MKPGRILLLPLLLLLLAGTSCSNGNSGTDLPADAVMNPNSATGNADQGALPKISFEKDFHDFGKLRAGEKVSYSFKFTNTGKSILVISNVSTSCGCTISDYPRKPVKPGETSTVDVSFDSEGRKGIQNKTITVLSNTQPSTTQLRIQANVVDPDEL